MGLFAMFAGVGSVGTKLALPSGWSFSASEAAAAACSCFGGDDRPFAAFGARAMAVCARGLRGCAPGKGLKGAYSQTAAHSSKFSQEPVLWLSNAWASRRPPLGLPVRTMAPPRKLAHRRAHVLATLVAALTLALGAASSGSAHELQTPAFYPMPVGSIKAAGWCARSGA